MVVPYLGFTVVFVGSSVGYVGTPPSGTYYVTRHGVFLKEPNETPYVYIKEGTIYVNPQLFPPSPEEVVRVIPMVINGTLLEVGLRG